MTVGAVRMVVEDGSCVRCGARVAISIDGQAALTAEEALDAILAQIAEHRAVCPNKDLPLDDEGMPAHA